MSKVIDALERKTKTRKRIARKRKIIKLCLDGNITFNEKLKPNFHNKKTCACIRFHNFDCRRSISKKILTPIQYEEFKTFDALSVYVCMFIRISQMNSINIARDFYKMKTP